MIQLDKLDDRLESNFPEELQQFRTFYFDILLSKKAGEQNEEGNKVRLILKTGIHYNGEIIELDDSTITILDKFNKQVMISKDSISTLEVLS